MTAREQPTCVMLSVLATASVLLFLYAIPRESFAPPLPEEAQRVTALPSGKENVLPAASLANQTMNRFSQLTHSDPTQPVSDSPSPNTSTNHALLNALHMGFNREELLALAQETDPQVLAAFFEHHTHITLDWLYAQGLNEDVLPTWYARWGAGASDTEQRQATERAYISRFSPRHDGGPLRLQDSFSQAERTLYLHYSTPESYGRDSILVRWTGGEGGAMQHFDWHALTDAAGLLQEAWYRPANDWAPGNYHVEVYAIGNTPELLTTITFTVE